VLFDETNPKSRPMVYRVPHIGLTLLAIGGLVLAGPALRHRLMPTIATAVAITVFHTLTIVSARFHIPIEPLMAIWGAAGLSRWEIGRVGRSAPAPHHVEGIRVVDRLGRVDPGGRIETTLGSDEQDRQGQTGEHRAAADHRRAPPSDGGQRDSLHGGRALGAGQ